ncbi:hypothetical protein GLOTRDRAFT_76289 [Gloeophyllum trabeum ATCC 11539]|uniref:PH domain-containing protein n=1 Tax=Gloeophyllum trabeum (strain ATCC 11539 / FP-39264 / Madison 617) TaxID=670483 RepID=S7RKW2_GLOTA|nr:uncharacterized protein GLOTRDRAFT_76289 [Gloeophyllum trabeum ATCC 11539]EPQ54980.1 hypothetical protein GLOTRDRAFT_76289 [Gloeophyllum trabeum ATCC 11539]
MDADEGNGTASRARPPVTDTALLSNTPFTSLPSSRSVSETSIPPPVPAKDAIRTREELIIEKRREARRRELDDDYLPPSTSNLGHGLPSTANIAGRPSRRRSMSTGDALDMLAQRRASDMRDSKLLDVPLEAEDDALGDSIDRELRKRGGNEQTRYRVREREETIYASSDTDRIRHMQSAGDLDSGQAWRTVRRPSDMNEYAKQIKEYRAQDKSGKSYGKVFVKVVGVKDLRVPIPREPTVMTCTLNNGIHYVTTPECPLSRDCHIGQEFELIEHPKLEFTLTLKVRRDAHIVSMCKALAPPPPVRQPPPAPPPSKGGLRSFFSSPKKTSHAANRLREVPPPAPPEIKENLARYLKPDGVLARAFISFKDVASRCDTKLFETSLPLLGQRLETASKMITTQVGEITLQIFRLPPLPGIPQDKLPQSLEECHDGLRHIHWHKQTYFEGTLTQSGGDCMTWRRRPFRVIGASLVAFNDVTKRATATIDLKKALAVRDDEEAGTMVPTGRYSGDDSLVGMERSFRILFPMNQEIVFFADTDDEKRRWLEVLRALVGRIPPNPLWAELIWQRQLEIAKHKNTSSISSPVAPSGLVPSRPNR